jgi:REP element-mobilizing transposase RayT
MDLPDRLHPNRLDEEEYRAPCATIFVSWRAQKGVALGGDAAQAIISVMGRMACNKGIHIEAYCVMPDHVHTVVSLGEDGDVQGWVRYVKREVARRCDMPGMWQRSYWDRHARKSQDVWSMVAYVLDNPVRGGLIREWQEWPHSWSGLHEGARGPDPNRK